MTRTNTTFGRVVLRRSGNEADGGVPRSRFRQLPAGAERPSLRRRQAEIRTVRDAAAMAFRAHPAYDRRMSTTARRVAALALSASALLAAAAPAQAQDRFTAGSPGLGDELFPFAGNGGYDVRHYDLGLEYDPRTQLLFGSTKIRARATQDLDQFNLDLRGFDVRWLLVNGKGARFRREGEHELVITPRPRLRAGERFTVEVDYEGVPQTVVDPDESIEGWIKTDDGAFVVNEPQGSPGWYPANDNPNDKATFDFHITVPEGKTALGNGVLVGKRTRRGKTTWHWSERLPMAPYLATATNGDFEYSETELANGLPFYRAVDPKVPPRGTAPAGASLDVAPEAIRIFEQEFGPYPFDAAGGIVDFAPDVGYALETQTKANYSSDPSHGTVVHEISHEWFGNAVSLARWKDIWLNEGFARFSEWLFTEKTGGQSAQASFQAAYDARPASSAFWNLQIGSPTAETMFSGSIYTRGGMTLQALRQKIGEATFSTLLKRWFAENKYGNVTTADFIALAEEVSGQQLDSFFQIWLYTSGKPVAGSW